MRCPGQDRRYWEGEVVFEALCPKCDAPVEFFKDETSGRCRKCGYRFRSPKVSFDCAKWCAYAEECLGFVSERDSPADPGEGALVSRLIRAVREEFAADQARVAHALLVFRHARELLATEGGDPRIVLAAALLLQVGEDQRSAKARRILQAIGLDEDTMECICHAIENRREGKDLDTIEFKVVSDADVLAKLAAENPGDDPNRPQHVIENLLRTKTGKERARSLLRVSPGEAEG